MDAADNARLGLNLNLSVQPQSYHWIRSPKGTDDEDEDDRRRGGMDDDGSPEEDPDILEMQVKINRFPTTYLGVYLYEVWYCTYLCYQKCR